MDNINYDEVLNYDRDWEKIKATLNQIDEQNREGYMQLLVRVAVYN